MVEERVDCITSLYYCCHVAVSVLCLFYTVLLVGLWHVNVAFPGHTHSFFKRELFLKSISEKRYNNFQFWLQTSLMPSHTPGFLFVAVFIVQNLGCVCIKIFSRFKSSVF